MYMIILYLEESLQLILRHCYTSTIKREKQIILFSIPPLTTVTNKKDGFGSTKPDYCNVSADEPKGKLQ